MARVGPGWDQPRPPRWFERGTTQIANTPIFHNQIMPEVVAICWACGNEIEPPVKEAFWCNKGCRYAWELAVAQKRLRECEEIPRPPREGYPLLEDELCDT